jgi:hypothetical protein
MTPKQTDKVEIFSTDGILLYRRSLANRISATIFLDDLPVLSKGAYLLKTSVNGKSYSKTIIR